MIFLMLNPIGIENDAFLAAVVYKLFMTLAFGSALFQFPSYGFILSYAELPGASRLWRVARVPVLIHSVASFAVLPFSIIMRA